MFRTGGSMNQTNGGVSTFSRSGKAVMSSQGGERRTSGQYQHGLNKSRMRMGSLHTGHVNYARDHTFFHGQDIVAPQVTFAAKQMKDLTDRDLLGRKKPEWTQSISVPKAETLTYSFNHPVKQDKGLFEVQN